MIRINLLPHREIRRQQQQKQFFIMLGTVVAIGAAIWFAVHSYLEDQFKNQVDRNKYLQSEIAKLDKQIAEIQKLKDQTSALLARKRVVETLQSTRSEVVHLLDQLVRQLPDGVYLKSIKQVGTRVAITGITQSQARVSTLMRQLDSSLSLDSPGLVEIKSTQERGQRVNEFIMNINITRASPEDVAGKPAPKPAAKR
ncbi:MAG: PilN domain-containing protein [Betaproteobacteria bacterium]|nr:PilN domain-containing protein [Betaproteobacteria bacterium]